MFMDVVCGFSLASEHIIEYSEVRVDRVKVQKVRIAVLDALEKLEIKV